MLTRALASQASLGLVNDLYQLTMAYGYWASGVAERRACFHLFFREPPFRGAYAVAAGLEDAVALLEQVRFGPEDTAYLATLTGTDGEPLFSPSFLQALEGFELRCDVDAIPEGTVVFGRQPLLRVTGPIWQCQLLETPLLNCLEFATLVATKATRVVEAAGTAPVLEFGLRRAQGLDAALVAARGAYIGGCAGTSHVLAGRLLDIPVRGTHAHSWVMFFEDEVAAFEAYAEAMPNNALFLVDTYDSLRGVDRAIEVGQRLRARGYELAGIRLDSGDFTYLSVEARRRLDEAGFDEARIVASGDLDEHLIEALRIQGAKVDMWGVGTKLITCFEQPSLGSVYKLGAVEGADGIWHPRLKRSESTAKSTLPGRLQVRRFYDERGFVGDMIFDLDQPVPQAPAIVDPDDPNRCKSIRAGTECEDLLAPVLRNGRAVAPTRPTLAAIRARRAEQLEGLHPGIRRFINPYPYPAGIERGLAERRSRMIRALAGLDG